MGMRGRGVEWWSGGVMLLEAAGSCKKLKFVKRLTGEGRLSNANGVIGNQ